MNDVDRVLIVGAGIAGLSLACRLRTLNVPHDLIEDRPHPDTHGAGILLTGNAVRALDTIGVGAAIATHGRRVDRVQFTDSGARELFHVDLTAQPRWPTFVSMQRASLHRVLLDAAKPTSVRWGTTLTSIEPRAGGIDVALSDGTRGRYRLVVGADGVHSDLRARIMRTAPIEPIVGYVGWRFLAPCPAGLESPQYMLGNGRTLLLHPLPFGEVYCGAGPVATEGTEVAGDDLERMRDAFRDFGGHATEVLARASAATLIPSRYFHIELPTWHASGCVLIGDAAHAAAPTLAQGAALAIEDAVVLAECLVAGGPIDEALARYERTRRPRVSAAQSSSLVRMHANRPVTSRGLTVRYALLRQIGADQLRGAWAPLMESSP